MQRVLSLLTDRLLCFEMPTGRVSLLVQTAGSYFPVWPTGFRKWPITERQLVNLNQNFLATCSQITSLVCEDTKWMMTKDQRQCLPKG